MRKEGYLILLAFGFIIALVLASKLVLKLPGPMNPPGRGMLLSEEERPWTSNCCIRGQFGSAPKLPP